MKKAIGIIILGLLWCNIVIAKEIRTRFGFYINLPNNYVAFQDQNLDELMKEYEGEEIDKDFFNDFFAGSSRQDMNVEYYFPKNFNAELNSININVQKDSNIKDAIEIGLSELCPYFTTLFGDLYNKNVQQYYCKFNIFININIIFIICIVCFSIILQFLGSQPAVTVVRPANVWNIY